MTDLLTPEEVRAIEAARYLWRHTMGDAVYSVATVHRLCRDYLTLHEKYEKKKAALKDRGVIESVLEICEEERDALKERVKHLEKTIDILDQQRGLKRA